MLDIGSASSVIGAIKATWEIASRIADRGAARRRRERLDLILERLRARQRGNPAPLVFSEPAMAQATNIPLKEIPDLLRQLAREGFIVPAPLGGWSLGDRMGGILSARRLFG